MLIYLCHSVVLASYGGVAVKEIIDEEDWSYLQETEDNRITLITCEENREEYRRCIQALEVASYKI